MLLDIRRFILFLTIAATQFMTSRYIGQPKVSIHCATNNFRALRHGPFDILGGGAWDLSLGRKFFFGQYRSKVIFFAGPSGRIIFFITESYKYRGFRDNFMLNNGFRDNYVLNSGFRNKFRLSSGFCHKFTLNLNFRVNCTQQEEQPDSFIVNLTLFLGSLANFTLRLIWPA